MYHAFYHTRKKCDASLFSLLIKAETWIKILDWCKLWIAQHNERFVYLLQVSLDPPIKQGQTRYHFLILLFNKEDEMTIEMGLSE